MPAGQWMITAKISALLNFIQLKTMNPESEQKQYVRWLATAIALEPYGWRAIGGMLFTKDGYKYDLSAADITQQELIAEKGLFRVD